MKKSRVISIIIVIFIFWFPLFSDALALKKYSFFQLAGASVKYKRPKLSFKSYMAKTYQKDFEKYLSRHLAFNKFYIRLFNTIYYIVFEKSYSSSDSIIIGKNKYLYENSYVMALKHTYNKENQNYKMIFDRQASELKSIQDWFTEKGKVFVLIITPSKAVFEKANIPERYDPLQEDFQTDLYKEFVTSLDKVNLVYADTISYIYSRKNENPVFVRGGIHWNDYGKYLGTQALIDTINSFSIFHILSPEIKSTSLTYKPKGEDNDLNSLLNLLYLPKNKSERIELKQQEDQEDLKIKFLSGSFGWGLVEMTTQAHTFSNIDYYFYVDNFVRQYRNFLQKSENHENMSVYNTVQDIIDGDIVILEINESLLLQANNNIEKFNGEMIKIINQK